MSYSFCEAVYPYLLTLSFLASLSSPFYLILYSASISGLPPLAERGGVWLVSWQDQVEDKDVLRDRKNRSHKIFPSGAGTDSQ